MPNNPNTQKSSQLPQSKSTFQTYH